MYVLIAFDAIARRMARYFASTRPAHPSELFPELTDREREILSLIAGHLGNADVAARLSLSEKTVPNHVSNIFDKLQVVDRVQAILRVREAELGK